MEDGSELWREAQALHLEGKFVEAEELYAQLLEQNHDNAGLMATLGSLYIQVNRIGLGIHFLEAAVKRGLKQCDVFTNLGIGYKKSGQQEKARKYFDLSVKEDPSPEALTNYSGLLIECGKNTECIDYCDRALKMDPQVAVAHWNKALCHLSDGAWEEGWKEHEWGMKAHHIREDRAVLDVPLWDGTQNKTVLIYGEQGLGDEIMFASMLPDLLKTNEVVLECHSRLETLFKKSFPEMPIYGTREDREVNWAYNHKVDYRTPIGGLGKFFRNKREDFPGTPYLKADPLPKGNKFRVGISWTGGLKPGRVFKRAVPLSWWKSILNVPNVEFVSLQYTNSEDDLNLMDGLGYDIKRMDEYAKHQDYYETARLVSSCDLVISVCTAVIHLAGALGVPCWVMTPKYPAWRYQNQGGMPWYKSVRLYRQPEANTDAWLPVVERIGLDLDDLVNERKQSKVA